MERNIIIYVTTRQVDFLSEPEEMNFVTEGKMREENGVYYITYRESEVTGMEGTTTTIEIAGDVFTLMRFGSVNLTMVFEKGKKHMSCYETTYGTFCMSVLTKNMHIDINENGGRISAEYFLEMDNLNKGRSQFIIDVRCIN